MNLCHHSVVCLFVVCGLVGLSAGIHKTTIFICLKLGLKMRLGPEQTPAAFGVVLDKVKNRGLFS